MIKIGKATLGRGPAIAITLNGRENPRSISKILRRVGSRRALPLLLELRIDRFPGLDEDSVIQRVRPYRKFGLPLIATIRSRKEGGARSLSETRRLQLFKKILPWVEAVDIELSSRGLVKNLVPLVRRKGKRTILSYHNFKTTPPDRALEKLIREGKRKGADLVKLAVTPRVPGDVGRLLLFTHRHRRHPLITIAMGRRGRASRLLAPLFGSLLTYGFLSRSQAPGQLPISELLRH